MQRSESVEDVSLTQALRRRSLGTPSAGALLFTVLGEYVLPRGGSAWSRTLIAAFRALDVEEKSARQAMSRTAQAGWLQRERSGREVRWELTDAALNLLRRGADRIYTFGAPRDEWDGRWLVLVGRQPEMGRGLRRRLSARLRWAGFGLLAPGVWVTAHLERESEARSILEDLKIKTRVFPFVGTVDDLNGAADVAATAWDLDDLEARYEAFIGIFARLRPRTTESAFRALTRLVHEWRRFPFLDPDLPAALLPTASSRTEAYDLFHRRYAAWKSDADAWFEQLSMSGPRA